MSTSVSPTSEPAPAAIPESAAARRARNGLVLFFAVVAIAVGLTFVLLPDAPEPATADLRLLSWQITADEWATQLESDRARAAAHPVGADEEAVFAALATYNEVELATAGDSGSPRLREAQTTLRAALRRYAGVHGVDGYHALGVHVRDRFVAALQAVLDGARTSGERPEIYVERRPLAPAVEEWRRWAGAFLSQALSAGLIEPDGTIAAGAAHIPGLLFLVRWFYWVQPVTDYTLRLSDTELFAVWAWKVERSEKLSLERRAGLIAQIVRIRPAYPAGYVRGVLLARADRWQDAAVEWRQWCTLNPDDERARENLRFALEVLASRHTGLPQ